MKLLMSILSGLLVLSSSSHADFVHDVTETVKNIGQPGSLAGGSIKELADSGYHCSYEPRPGIYAAWASLSDRRRFRCTKPNKEILFCSGNLALSYSRNECWPSVAPIPYYSGAARPAGIFKDRETLYQPANAAPVPVPPLPPNSPPRYVPPPASNPSTPVVPYQPPPRYVPPPVASPVTPPPRYVPPPVTPPSSPPAYVPARRELSIDLNRYCRENFGAEWTAGLQPGGGVNDWFCQMGRNERRGMDLRTGCKQQHNSNEIHFRNESDPNSWYCVVYK